MKFYSYFCLLFCLTCGLLWNVYLLIAEKLYLYWFLLTGSRVGWSRLFFLFVLVYFCFGCFGGWSVWVCVGNLSWLKHSGIQSLIHWKYLWFLTKMLRLIKQLLFLSAVNIKLICWQNSFSNKTTSVFRFGSIKIFILVYLLLLIV